MGYKELDGKTLTLFAANGTEMYSTPVHLDQDGWLQATKWNDTFYSEIETALYCANEGDAEWGENIDYDEDYNETVYGYYVFH